MTQALRSGLATSRPVLIAILAVTALLALVSAVLFQAPGLLGRDKVLTDFDAFHIAGTMAMHGQADETYRAAEMLAAQQAIAGDDLLLPWTYPPPYTLFVAALARLPIGLAYLLFLSGSLLFCLAVLRRIAGEYLPGTLIAILPAMLLTVRTGQNGFLTAGLIGAFLLAFPARRAVAGLPLGLMCIKPHLAAGIGLLALFRRRWSAMALAAGLVLALALASTLAFGQSIWGAFLGGVREAGDFLAAGYYQLFRMNSVYACVRSLGASAPVAIVLHGLGRADRDRPLPAALASWRRAAGARGGGLRDVAFRQPLQLRLRSHDPRPGDRFRAARHHRPRALGRAGGAALALVVRHRLRLRRGLARRERMALADGARARAPRCRCRRHSETTGHIEAWSGPSATGRRPRRG